VSVETYIETLKLADDNYRPGRPRAPFAGFGSTRSTKAGVAAARGPDAAAVDVGSLLSFVEGTSAQERDDVLFSVQLAQRGAAGLFNRFTQPREWYGKYVEILETIGWTAEQLAFARFEQSKGEVRMDKAALAIIAAIATQNQLAVLGEAVKALESLAEEDDTIRFFDFHTTAQTSGNFQLGSVQKSSNGSLAMALGAFHFTSTDDRRKFLFVSWGKQDVEFWTAAQKMTLNQTFYAGKREQVKAKLGAKAGDYIEALVLG
jgi:hypothetical protein